MSIDCFKPEWGFWVGRRGVKRRDRGQEEKTGVKRRDRGQEERQGSRGETGVEAIHLAIPGLSDVNDVNTDVDAGS